MAKRAVGRPKDTWKPGKDGFVIHAAEAKVTESLQAAVLADILKGAHLYKNPIIRLQVADAVLRLETELIGARREAVQELRSMGWPWTRIGKVLGVSRQRAWDIGTGR
jgi:hypothetical protein